MDVTKVIGTTAQFAKKATGAINNAVLAKKANVATAGVTAALKDAQKTIAAFDAKTLKGINKLATCDTVTLHKVTNEIPTAGTITCVEKVCIPKEYDIKLPITRQLAINSIKQGATAQEAANAAKEVMAATKMQDKVYSAKLAAQTFIDEARGVKIEKMPERSDLKGILMAKHGKALKAKKTKVIDMNKLIAEMDAKEIFKLDTLL